MSPRVHGRITAELVNYVEECGINIKELEVVGADGTSVNTGHEVKKCNFFVAVVISYPLLCLVSSLPPSLSQSNDTFV